MKAKITINGKTYYSAEYDSNDRGNGLWCDGKQIVGTCQIHPTERQLKAYAKNSLVEKLERAGVIDVTRVTYTDNGIYAKIRVTYC